MSQTYTQINLYVCTSYLCTYQLNKEEKIIFSGICRMAYLLEWVETMPQISESPPCFSSSSARMSFFEVDLPTLAIYKHCLLANCTTGPCTIAPLLRQALAELCRLCTCNSTHFSLFNEQSTPLTFLSILYVGDVLCRHGLFVSLFTNVPKLLSFFSQVTGCCEDDEGLCFASVY